MRGWASLCLGGPAGHRREERWSEAPAGTRQRQEAAPCGCIFACTHTSAGDALQCDSRVPRIERGSSYGECGWRGFLSLTATRLPCRDGRATRPLLRRRTGVPPGQLPRVVPLKDSRDCDLSAGLLEFIRAGDRLLTPGSPASACAAGSAPGELVLCRNCDSCPARSTFTSHARAAAGRS
jgi:hypothetical protein